MIIFAILAFINIITWYPVLSFWFFQSWEATWLLGNCGQNVNPICLMQGHALLYFLDYKIFGWNPWGWYLTTLILHIVAVYLGYRLLVKFTKERMFSFLVALLFGVNITYYDVLTWGSFNGLYALIMVFFLSSSILYIKIVEKGRMKLILYTCIALLLLVGLFVRESSLILPVFLVLGYVYKKGFGFSKKDFIFILKSILPLVVLIAVYFLIRKIYGGPTYDYIDETVQYRVKLLSQGLYLEYFKRAFLLIGLLVAPQAIPFQFLNIVRDAIAAHFHPKFINLYFFPM